MGPGADSTVLAGTGSRCRSIRITRAKAGDLPIPAGPPNAPNLRLASSERRSPVADRASGLSIRGPRWPPTQPFRRAVKGTLSGFSASGPTWLQRTSPWREPCGSCRLGSNPFSRPVTSRPTPARAPIAVTASRLRRLQTRWSRTTSDGVLAAAGRRRRWRRRHQAQHVWPVQPLAVGRAEPADRGSARQLYGGGHRRPGTVPSVGQTEPWRPTQMPCWPADRV